MADPEGGATRGAIVVVPGERTARLARVLRALAPDLPLESASDPEALLGPAPGRGRLVLDIGHIPSGDIGFIRRFLKRRPDWGVVLVGDEVTGPVADVLADERVVWLRGETAAGEVERPAGPSGRARGSDPAELARLPALIRRLRRSLGGLRRALARGAEPEPELAALDAVREDLTVLARRAGVLPRDDRPTEFDLHPLVEELLADSLLAPRSPRFRFRSEGDLRLTAVRDHLRRALGHLLSLAAECGSRGTVIELRAAAGPRPDAPLVVALDFPAGPLAGVPARDALSRAILAERLSARAADRSGRAALLLRDLGARLGVAASREGRLRIELSLPRAPGDSSPPGVRIPESEAICAAPSGAD